MGNDSKATKNIKKGWIPLLRSMRDHKRVGFKKPFSRAEAWIWLLFEAEWENTSKLFTFGNSERHIECPAGTVTHSQRFMASAFGWSRKRLRTFLALLDLNDEISQKVYQQITQISISNWYTYRNALLKKEPAGVPAGAQQGPSGCTKHKEANKLINKEGVKSIIIRAEEFKTAVEKYIPDYGPELVRSFFLFWSEKGKDEMMKFEHDKMFQIDTAVKSFSLAAYFKSTLEDDDIKKVKKKDIENWLLIFDQCQRIDDYNYDQIHDIIEYFRILHDKENGDMFSWRTNWISPVKLRRKNNDDEKYIDYFWRQIREKVEYGD